MSSQWTNWVKDYAKKNNVTYREALSLARDSYQSQTKTKPLLKPKLKPNKKLQELLPMVPKPVKKRAAKKKPIIGGTSHICAGCGLCS